MKKRETNSDDVKNKICKYLLRFVSVMKIQTKLFKWSYE